IPAAGVSQMTYWAERRDDDRSREATAASQPEPGRFVRNPRQLLQRHIGAAARNIAMLTAPVVVPIRHAPLSSRTVSDARRWIRLPTTLSICHPPAPRNVSTCIRLFAPASHAAVTARTPATTANAASAVKPTGMR